MDIRFAIGALGGACALAACATLPLPQAPVTLWADFEAPSSAGRIRFQGSVALRGQRSLWDGARFGPLDHSLASRALERALTQALGEAPTARSERTWTRGLEEACAQALAEDAGGRWSAKLAPGFALDPARQSDP